MFNRIVEKTHEFGIDLVSNEKIAEGYNYGTEFAQQGKTIVSAVQLNEGLLVLFKYAKPRD